jgi:hypothetical protein
VENPIETEKLKSKRTEQNILIFLILIIIIIVISFVGIYSYRKFENLKYYDKLSIDDENLVSVISNNSIKTSKMKVNWEAYDSEK